MKEYEFLPHTADVRIRAYGSTLEEAFIHAAYATTDVVTDHSKVEGVVEKLIEVKGEDLDSLFYEFIEEFLVLIDSERFLLHEIKELEIEDNSLTAHLVGDTDVDKYEINTHVKAMTYQELKIEKKDGFVIGFILDI